MVIKILLVIIKNNILKAFTSENIRGVDDADNETNLINLIANIRSEDSICRPSKPFDDIFITSSITQMNLER